MHPVLNLHLTNSGNVGDEYCAPYHYFDIPQRGHINDETDSETIVIYGGGAIANGAIRHREQNSIKTSIVWGVGSTKRGVYSEPPQTKFDGFSLVGVRDYTNKNHEWVPCASCMSPLFDDIPDPIQTAVYYGHASLSPMGEFNNNHMNFAEVIRHLSKGETVVTSSYHGAYWASLMGRKVVCLPFGSKFYGLKHPPRMVNRYCGFYKIT